MSALRNAGRLEPYGISDAEARVQFLETWRLPRRLFTKGFGGFRPVIGGMPSGSGFAGGGGYITGYHSDLLQFTANARYSTRGYQLYDAGFLIFPRSNSLLPVEGYVRSTLRDFHVPAVLRARSRFEPRRPHNVPIGGLVVRDRPVRLGWAVRRIRCHGAVVDERDSLGVERGEPR